MALDFLILYEHTVREYESDLLLKLELERRGYTAEIRQLLDPKHLRLFGKDKPEVLVASCMYDNEAINSHVYNNIRPLATKSSNLHWEQMLYRHAGGGRLVQHERQRQALRADLLGQAHRRPPAGPRHGRQKHARDRRGHDGLSAPGV